MALLRLRPGGLSWSKVGDDVVILDLESSTYFAVAGCGTLIVECLAGGATEESLVDSVTSNYEVDPATARADVARFVRGLEDNKMLERIE